MGMGWIGLQQHQGGVSLYGHEQVIKIMCNAPCQGADCLHLLGLLKLGLKTLSVAHIPGNPMGPQVNLLGIINRPVVA